MVYGRFEVQSVSNTEIKLKCIVDGGAALYTIDRNSTITCLIDSFPANSCGMPTLFTSSFDDFKDHLERRDDGYIFSGKLTYLYGLTII